MPLRTIISGGQTGADRGALDAALALGFPCGGWCPEGRLAEDGPLSAEYPLEAVPGGGYRARTIENVRRADGTAIFYFGRPTGGTELTLTTCIRLHKPYRLVDAREIGPPGAADMLHAFTSSERIEVLNVAGPRESTAPGVYDYVLGAIRLLICLQADGADRDNPCAEPARQPSDR